MRVALISSGKPNGLQYLRNNKKKLKESLTQHGWETREFLFQNLNSLEKVLDEYRNDNIEELLFFYTGHGETSGRRNLLKLQLESGNIDVNTIIDLIFENKPNKYAIILDACYSGTIDDIEFEYDTEFLFSSSEDEQSYEEKNLESSIFTHYFCELLNSKQKNITLEKIKNYIEKKTSKQHAKYISIDSQIILNKQSIDLEVIPEDTTYSILTPLPPKNADFIGRRRELKEIKKYLNKNSMIYVVNGIGGVGKSELSYQYLHLNKHRYNYIAFLEFTEEVSSLEDLLFAKFQDALLLDKDSTFDTIIKRLQSLPPRNLLVLDNIENPNDFEKLKVLNINFDLLITTRIKLDIKNQLNLNTLDYPDAKKLFLSIYNINSDISDILIYLDKHPLFINLMAKSLKEEYIELDELRENIKNNTIAKIDSKDDKTFQEHLQDTFSRQFIRETNDELKELLQILALFPSIEIDFTVLKRYINTTRLKPKLQKLVARGWLSKKENSYKLHQIIKTFILEEYPIEYGRITLVFMVKKENISDAYISFLESFLKYFQDIEDEYITKILDVLTSFYKNLMQYKKALIFQIKSMEMKEKVFGKKSECTANSYNIIGELYLYLSDFEKSLDYLERALSIRKELFGENHLDIADSYKSLAFFYRVVGRRQLDRFWLRGPGPETLQRRCNRLGRIVRGHHCQQALPIRAQAQHVAGEWQVERRFA